MGKKLIIKGADFSENGIKERVITSDQSALFNDDGVQVTAENLASQEQAKRVYYRVFNPNSSTATEAEIGKLTNAPAVKFYNRFSVGDYQTLVVNVNDTGGTQISNYYTAGIIFLNNEGKAIKVYAKNSGAAESYPNIYVNTVTAAYNAEITIPEDAVECIIVDIVNTVEKLASHSVVLKKVVID